MRQNAQNFALFLVLASAAVGGWYYVEKTFFPPPPPEPEKPRRESLLAIAGSAVAATKPAEAWPMRRLPEPPKPPEEKATDSPRAEPTPPKAAEPPTFTQLGDDASYTKLILTSRGGAVQQVTLTRFEEANRLGREEKRADGSPQPLRVVPGVVKDRSKVSLTDVHDNPAVDVVPDLVPGVVADPELRGRLAEPSYVVLQYLNRDDERPSADLGERTWTLAEAGRTDGGGWKAVYQTDLPAPDFLRLKKTFTLGPKDYHVGFQFEMVPLPGRTKDKGEFRYQIVGPRGMPIEGEWYTTTFRNVMAGWTTPTGGAMRSFDDALNIQIKHGGDKVVRNGNTFNYAAVATQYFAGAVAIDDTQPKEVRAGMWDYVRPTREQAPWDRPDQQFLADVTVRAVSSAVAVGDQPVSHSYLLYHGPVKVSLLGQLRDAAGREQAVAPALVERYTDALSLRTLTDYPSPNFFGRMANFLWWSDLIIFFTNVMHWVLGVLHGIVPVWGLNIVMLTVLVRLALFYPSRKQQTAMLRMQEKMTKLKPEVDKLQEKYKDDWRGMQQAKAELMRRNGANPVSTMGGCALLFAQMPVLMGLYFCLQESVFFRLDPFLGWIANLAAPDMLVWWSELIPFVSSPDGLGGTFYLGPYLNILPIISVVLIFIQQKITLPPPTDEQMEMQQKTMKMMVIFMAVFFYKVPAGLCIYFICGTLWALGERKLIPKVKVSDSGPVVTGPPASRPVPADPAKEGGFLAKIRAIAEEKQRQYEEQTKRQIRNAPPDRNRGGAGGRDRKKRK
jgi:YidC/Oxa1 family membrane protein insertase